MHVLRGTIGCRLDSGLTCHRRLAADQQGAMLCFLLGNILSETPQECKLLIKQAHSMVRLVPYLEIVAMILIKTRDCFGHSRGKKAPAQMPTRHLVRTLYLLIKMPTPNLMSTSKCRLQTSHPFLWPHKSKEICFQSAASSHVCRSCVPRLSHFVLPLSKLHKQPSKTYFGHDDLDSSHSLLSLQYDLWYGTSS